LEFRIGNFGIIYCGKYCLQRTRQIRPVPREQFCWGVVISVFPGNPAAGSELQKNGGNKENRKGGIDPARPISSSFLEACRASLSLIWSGNLSRNSDIEYRISRIISAFFDKKSHNKFFNPTCYCKLLEDPIQNSKISFFLRRNFLKENVENLTYASGVATWSRGTHINLKEAPRDKKNIFRAGHVAIAEFFTKEKQKFYPTC